MNWSQRLESLPHGIALSANAGAEILEWNYRAHLSDNAPHRHTYCEVCLVGDEGEGEFRIAGRTHCIGPGDVFFARPGAIHQIVNTRTPNMELFWVGFGLDGPSGAVAALHRAFRGSEVMVAQDEAVQHLWRALRAVSESGKCGWEIEGQCITAALLLALLRAGAGHNLPVTLAAEHENGGDRRVLARAAVRYVEDNLNRKLQLAEIANHLHVSPRQLTRLFVEATGLSPAAYIERARLDRAQRLLLQTEGRLKEVAREVGFEDTSHFSRVFSRRYGAPPGEFRKRSASVSGPNVQQIGAYI